MTIEFLPGDARYRDVTPQLIRSLTLCYSVEGSIAYWTLPTDALGGKLLKALSKAGSSICVDLQSPTKLRHLAEYTQELAKTRDKPTIYLHVEKQAARKGEDVASLLHTKLLLFNMGNQAWEIWIGSHNFTNRALYGDNLEAGVRIVGRSDEAQFAPLLNDVKTYLQYIRSHCQPFDSSQLTQYESLQGSLDDKSLIERLKAQIKQSNIIVHRVLTIKSKAADQLANQTIILMGNLPEELSAIRFRNRGGTPVYVRAKDIDTGIVYTYKAFLRANDSIDNVPSSDVRFNQRRWALRQVNRKNERTKPPTLQELRDVDTELIKTNKYYVNVQIVGQEAPSTNVDYYTYPETDLSKLWRISPEGNFRPRLQITGYNDSSTPEVKPPMRLVPVANAEELTQVQPIVWGDNFEDRPLDKQVLVFK